MAPFRPTHEITLTDRRDGSRKPSIYVQVVDGVGYTAAEWESETAADWTVSDDGEWSFQGRATPNDSYTVSVRVLHRDERARRGREALAALRAAAS